MDPILVGIGSDDVVNMEGDCGGRTTSRRISSVFLDAVAVP